MRASSASTAGIIDQKRGTKTKGPRSDAKTAREGKIIVLSRIGGTQQQTFLPHIGRCDKLIVGKARKQGNYPQGANACTTEQRSPEDLDGPSHRIRANKGGLRGCT